MKASLFILGNSYIASSAFLREVGLEPVVIKSPNKQTITLGVLNSPEFACFPFKVLLGMMIQALDNGAELFIMPSGNSQMSCQLSEFARAHEHIMRKTGKKFEILRLDSLKPQRLLLKFKKYNPSLTLQQFTKALLIGRQKIILLETVEECYRTIFLSEGKLKAEGFRKRWNRKIDDTKSIVELHFLTSNILKDFSLHKKISPDVLKIAVIGDIYCLNDTFVNNDIYERLLAMGVYVKQGINLSIMLGNPISINVRDMLLERKAEKYLKHNVASYAKNTIKDAIGYSEEGYDGLIQIYPFNCMPEVTARNILPKICKDYNMPILHLPIDEQTGDAGFATRIEAFVDLLKMRKGK